MTSPAPADVYAAVMSFPYKQWIAAPDAAAHVEDVGLSRDALRLVIRTGRRRGLLCTKREPDRLGFYVMRVAEARGGEQRTGNRRQGRCRR